MPKLGFEFRETMAGTWTHKGKPGEQRPITFTLRVMADDAVRHARDHHARVEGTLEMPGFADEAAVAGTMEIAPFTRKVIRYDLSFVGNDGQPYRLAGQKDIRFTDFVTTMTTLPADVLDARGQAVAHVHVTFDVKADLLPFLASWKPRRAHA
jgi:hypothetical protein